MISLSYAKISFSDVARKLQLDSSEDAEYIVAKVCLHLLCSFPRYSQLKHNESYVEDKSSLICVFVGNS
jgi:hypothetical protein